ncbi:MAG: glycosyltransferase [Proteobacteria bacterium]|nr:glycosyltransferase [Pseudomonadota bacterium]
MKNLPIRLFVGYFEWSPIHYHAFVQSVLQHATHPVAITPLKLNHLKGFFTRERTPDQLTDFSYSRFLVPYLCNYEGWAIFMDGADMMLREDISKLWALRDEAYDVMLVKHADIQGEHQFQGKTISSYKMFNWSSLMLFNNAKCTKLTLDYVNNADYHELHQFKWLAHVDRIGDLPATWNHLVGYHPPREDVALVHWTQGVPSMKAPSGLAFEEEWRTLLLL